MLLTCGDLNKLETFAKIKLVAGEAGLSNAITWPYVNQSKSVANWIHGGELVFITGLEFDYSEERLLTLFEECCQQEVSGVVILCHENYIPNIPLEVSQRADFHKVPVYEMPWDMKIIDVTKEITNAIIQTAHKERSVSDFFFELLFAHDFDCEIVNRIGRYVAIDVGIGGYISIFGFTSVGKTYTEEQEKNRLTLLQHAILQTLGSGSISILRGGYIIVYTMKNPKVEKAKQLAHLENELEKFQKLHSNLRIFAGVGSTAADIVPLRESYATANKSMRAAAASLATVFINWQENSAFLSMIPAGNNVKQVENFVKSILGKLMVSDDEHGTEYILTLRQYFAANCIQDVAAESLNIHKNTLTYRLKKIDDLTDSKLAQVKTKVNYINAIDVADYFNML